MNDIIRSIKKKAGLVRRYIPHEAYEASRLLIAGLAGVIANNAAGYTFLPTIILMCFGIGILSLSLAVFRVLYGHQPPSSLRKDIEPRWKKEIENQQAS